MSEPFKVDEAGLWVALRLQPRASRPGFGGLQGDRVQLKVSSPPVDGAANQAAREFLSKAFKCPKSQVHLKQGEKSREKTFLLERWDQDALEKFQAELG
ncbi:MAG: DUF167 domain-containing protein [bacterium]|nr:DUF167 domain-containing protein [bacterium]